MKALLYLKQGNKLTKFGEEFYSSPINGIKEIIVVDSKYRELAKIFSIEIVPNEMRLTFKKVLGTEIGEEAMFICEKNDNNN